MFRRCLVLLAAAALSCGRTPAGAPLADDLPEHTVLYVGVPDVPDLAARLRALPIRDGAAWRSFVDAAGLAPLIDAFARHESRLKGTAALVAWPGPQGLDYAVLLPAGLARGSGTEEGWHYTVEGSLVVAAPSADVLARFRQAPRARLPVAFSEGQAVAYVVPRAFPSEAWALWCARWRDFRSVSMRIEVGADLRFRALARYAGAGYRHALERLVHAPGRAAPPPGVAAWTAQMEHPPRLWGDVLAALDDEDRQLVDREIRALEGTQPDPVGTFLPRLGPMWGAAVTRSGAAVAAVEARGAAELVAALRRVIADYAGAMRKRGRPVRVELDGEEPRSGRWRAALRAEADRLALGDAPPLWGEGPHHAGTVLDFAALAGLDPALPFEGATPWIARLQWARRAEAWTRFTGEGARIEARLSFAE